MSSVVYRIKYLILAVVAVASLSSCVKDNFSLRLQFPADYVGNYLVAYYSWNSDRGAWVEQTASVQGGVAEVECASHKPTLVYVSDASSPSKYIVVYAEKGDKITISGESSDMRTWKVTGNKIAGELAAWEAQASPGETPEQRNARVAAFVKKNPKSKVSAILLLTAFDRRGNPEEFVKLWNIVDKDVRTNELIEMCECPDLQGVLFGIDAAGNLKAAAEKRLALFIVRSEGNGIDTLTLAKKPSFIYFYRDNNDARNQAIDSLRALVKAYPDSAKRIICDVASDIDSVTWMSALRYDTLSKVVRGWAPHGLTDENLVKAGVSRLPWYRVASAKGKVEYSGAELDSALKVFRRQMK